MRSRTSGRPGCRARDGSSSQIDSGYARAYSAAPRQAAAAQRTVTSRRLLTPGRAPAAVAVAVAVAGGGSEGALLPVSVPWSAATICCNSSPSEGSSAATAANSPSTVVAVLHTRLGSVVQRHEPQIGEFPEPGLAESGAEVVLAGSGDLAGASPPGRRGDRSGDLGPARCPDPVPAPESSDTASGARPRPSPGHRLPPRTATRPLDSWGSASTLSGEVTRPAVHTARSRFGRWRP